MSTEYIETSSEKEWLGLRSKNINSTETAALFGLSKYETEMELFHRKQAGEIVVLEDNIRMKCGRILEPAIAELFGDILSCDVKPFKLYACDPVARMGSSFDFEITSGKYNGYLLELKNVDRSVYSGEWTDDEASDGIEIQVQHQLELTRRPGAIIGALVGGNDPRHIVRERNERMGAGIRKRIERFWKDVAEDNAPTPDFRRDAEFLIGLYQEAGESVFDASSDAHITTLLREYKRMRGEAKDLEEASKAIKAEVFTLIGDANKVITDGITVACGRTKDTPPKIITPDMVGQEIGGRKGYRQFRVTERKQK